jgi:hypothetical protein
MNKFNVGDKVRRTTSTLEPEKYGRNGQEYIVLAVRIASGDGWIEVIKGHRAAERHFELVNYAVPLEHAAVGDVVMRIARSPYPKLYGQVGETYTVLTSLIQAKRWHIKGQQTIITVVPGNNHTTAVDNFIMIKEKEVEKFKVGDTVRRFTESQWPNEFGAKGQEYTVLDVDSQDNIKVSTTGSYTRQSNFTLVLSDVDHRLFVNKTPYGLLSKEMQESFAASSGPFEVYTKRGDWTQSYAPDGGNAIKMLSNRVYRLMPKPATTKPSIDWTQIDPRFKYLTTDKDGKSFVYQDMPTWAIDEWCNRQRLSEVNFLVSYVAGTCDPKDSLVERPKT